LHGLIVPALEAELLVVAESALTEHVTVDLSQALERAAFQRDHIQIRRSPEVGTREHHSAVVAVYPCTSPIRPIEELLRWSLAPHL
jgi:hypothetical protein